MEEVILCVEIKKKWICLQNGCKKQPNFNMEGETKALYCSTHKLDGMVNVVTKRCIESECKTKPVFNKIGEKQGLYCSTHKLDGMVDVVTKRCLFDGCKKQPKFNKFGEKKPLYCSMHKLSEMINVISKQCIFDGCKKNPNFNTIEEKQGLYCSTHKLDGMIDVVHIQCIFNGCEKNPSFNTIGKKQGLYCSTHKLDGMINVISKRCIFDGCEKQPNFNKIEEKKPLYCSTHKLDEMINVKIKRCKTPFCSTRPSNKQYEGYCLYCFINTFPDKKVARNYKTKETSVKDHIFSQFPHQTWHWDRTIQDGCSKRRPDIYCDLGDNIIIIEIDENQHTDYDSTCEIARLNQLAQDVYFRPIQMIRFNPDDYINEKGKKVTTCWKTGKDGIVKISDKKQTEWTNRLTRLSDEITKTINRKNDKSIELIQITHLFYDLL